eukprot:SAG31_NODE_1279_length_9036_cov_1.858454_4_plen_439_part_00
MSLADRGDGEVTAGAAPETVEEGKAAPASTKPKKQKKQRGKPPQPPQQVDASSQRIKLLEHEIERLRQHVGDAHAQPGSAALRQLGYRQPKLIILDLNGLLLYRTMAKAKSDKVPTRPHDRRAGAFNVWLRPHAVSFLDFLLVHFHVAIWSSAQLQNILPLVKFLRPKDGAERFAFIWSQTECTDSGSRHADNARRPLFLKETTKVFALPEHAALFSDQNTLLIDDDSYKASRNPEHTCISPLPYAGENEDEDCNPSSPRYGGLSPHSQLRRWLEQLALADSVPAFVAANPWPPTAAQHRFRAASAGDSKTVQGSNELEPQPETDTEVASPQVDSEHRAQKKADKRKQRNKKRGKAPAAHAQRQLSAKAGVALAEPQRPTVLTPSSVTSDRRLEVTNALRTAVLSSDREALRAAVNQAQQLGLVEEAQTGQAKLDRMQ